MQSVSSSPSTTSPSRVAANPGAEVISEERVDPAYLVGRDDMSGTVDVQLIGSTGIEIIDYKDGINPVEAKDNEQMEQYALGIIAKYMRRVASSKPSP